ncbi:hypothetical protein LCGC14_1098340 [marine sediment metagenome]|uniref:Uncharacterized protein n=1 Tax=marine sediment metagenome TaxID=412755 RepID=A0A0F9MAF3_9ZZZZ
MAKNAKHQLTEAWWAIRIGPPLKGRSYYMVDYEEVTRSERPILFKLRRDAEEYKRTAVDEPCVKRDWHPVRVDVVER